MTNYQFDSILVADPSTFQRMPNASVSVYDIDDTANASPLALTDLNGLALANPLTSSADAFLPAFSCPSAQVKLVAGQLAIPVGSFKSVLDQATAAKEFVQGIGVSQVITGDPGTSAAVTVDANGKMTFTVPQGPQGNQGNQGPKGLDGANGVPTDQAVATAIDDNTTPSATRGALNALYAPVSHASRHGNGGADPLYLPVNVKLDYGAKGDGVTDDTAAIQAAITAAAGRALFFPPGTYMANNLTSSGANTVICSDASATIKKNAAGILLTVTGDNTRVTGLTLDGALLGERMVIVRNCVGGLIADCRIVNIDPANYAIHTWSNDYLTVRNNHVEGPVQGSNSDNVSYIGNKIYVLSTNTANSSPLAMIAQSYTTSHSNSCKMVDNYIEVGNNTFGIGMSSRNGAILPSQWVISGNTIVTTASNCYGGMTIDTAGNGTIVGNTFRVGPGSTPGTAAIEVVQSQGVTLVGNNLDAGGVMNAIVTVNRSVDITLSGNVLANPNPTGLNTLINVMAPGAGNVTARTLIIGNKFLIPAGSSSGVQVMSNNATASINDTTIVGNHFFGNSSCRAVVLQNPAGTISNTTIRNNTVNTASCAFESFNSDTGTIITGNRLLSVATNIAAITGSSFAGVVPDGNDWQWATAAPTTQYHFRGERIANSAPAVGSPTGWVCTVAGTPGTWVALANL